MCLGVPMQVEKVLQNGAMASCRGQDSMQFRNVSTGLLDAPPAVGDWLLIHIDTAIRSISATEAQQVSDALCGIAAAQRGEAFDHLFADLIDREPQLPDHLQDKHASEETAS